MDETQRQIGERLRAIRSQQGLTLEEVEHKSGGRWKAVVVGSYERGDRAISVAKLASLAAFYGVPVTELLPDADREREREREPRVILDLAQLDDRAPGILGALARYARRIQLARGDYNGRVLTIRTADAQRLAAACGVTFEQMLDHLEEHQMLRR